MRRRMLSRWVRAGMLMAVFAAPVILVGYQQRHQIAFLAHRGYATARHVLTSQWFGPVAATVVGWCLILVAVGAAAVTPSIADGPHADDRASLTVLALLWLVLPTAVLLLGNALVSPTYNVRYLAPSTPAAAILIALGIAAIARAAAPAWRSAGRAGLASCCGAAVPPATSTSERHGRRTAAAICRRSPHTFGRPCGPGGIVVFDQSTKPSRDPRARARPLSRPTSPPSTTSRSQTPFADRAGLWDAVVIPNRATWRTARRSADVWAIELREGVGWPSRRRGVPQDAGLRGRIRDADPPHHRLPPHRSADDPAPSTRSSPRVF